LLLTTKIQFKACIQEAATISTWEKEKGKKGFVYKWFIFFCISRWCSSYSVTGYFWEI